MKEEFKGVGLYAKINHIQTALYDIEKNGKNTFAKYSYKRFTDIKQAFNNLLMDTGIVFLPTNSTITPEDMGFKATPLQKGAMVQYIQEYSLIDSEKEGLRHNFYFPMIAANNDGADKANGSAVTYGLKYLFNLWGLIPDEALDPDTTEQTKALKGKEKLNEPPKQVVDKVHKDLMNEVREICMHDDNAKMAFKDITKDYKGVVADIPTSVLTRWIADYKKQRANKLGIHSEDNKIDEEGLWE